MAKIYTRKESKYWWTEFKDPTGQRTRCSTGINGTQELKEKAQLKANQMELDAWTHWSPGKEKILPRTFEELSIAYLKAALPGQGHKNNLKKLREFFAGKVLHDLTKRDVSAYIEWRRPRNTRYPDRPVANNTIRRELGVLSAMINYANEAWEWELPNPIMGRRPKATKNRIRWAHPEQIRRLVETAKSQTGTPWLADFIELAVNTGMRKSELLGCALARVDLMNNCIHLNPEHQKNGCYGTVPLNRSARRVIMRRLTWIKAHKPASKWLFPSRLGTGRMVEVRKPFQEACEAVGLEDFRPHDLRHTFASWLAQSGVPLYDIKEAMRHSDIKQTEKYAHLRNDTAQRVVEVLDTSLTQYVPQPRNSGQNEGHKMESFTNEIKDLIGRGGRI